MSRSELVGCLVDVLAGLWVVTGAYLAGSMGEKNLRAVFLIMTWPFWVVVDWYHHLVASRGSSDD